MVARPTPACCADEVDSLLGVRKDMDHEATIAVRNEFMQVRTRLLSSHRGRLQRPGWLRCLHSRADA